MQGLWIIVLGLTASLSGIAIEPGEGVFQGPEPILLLTVVSFEKGELALPLKVRLCDCAGNAVPADFIPTAFWEDGTVRVLTIRAVLPAHRAGGGCRLFLDRESVTAAGAISIRRQRSCAVVDTGPLVVSLDGNTPGFVSDICFLGRNIDDLAEGLDLALFLDGMVLRPRKSLLYLEAGRATAKACFNGWLYGPGGEVGPGYQMQFVFRSGSARMECRIVLEGGPVTGASSGIFIRMNPPWQAANAPVQINAGSLSITRTPLRGSEIVVRACPTRVEVVEADDRFQASKGGDIRVLLAGCNPDMLIDLPDFGHRHPWSVLIRPGGTVTLSLLNERFTWDPYFSFQRDFVLRLAKKGRLNIGGPQASTRRISFQLPSSPARRSLPYAGCSAITGRDPLADLFLAVTEDLLVRLKAEWERWDGCMNYGDYRKSYGIWANQEYDPAFGLLKRFLWTGHPRDMNMARSSLMHWRHHDRAGKDDPSAPPGTPWMHGPEHRSGRTEPGHMWLDGSLLYALMTGNKEYLDAALQVGGYLDSVIPQLKTTKLERSVAWSLIAFCALVEAGHERFRPAMDRTATILRSRQLENGLMAFKEILHDNQRCYVANTWVTAGITVEALYRHFRTSGDGRSRQSAVRALRAVLEHGFDPETDRYFQRIYFKKSGGDILHRSGIVRGGPAAMLGLGTARAFALTNERALGTRAHGLIKRSLIDLRNRPPEYPGEDLAMLMRVGLDVIVTLRQ